MAGEGLSPEVIRFIQSTISSVEQLEVLLFLMSNAERSWTPAEISERTRLPAESVASRLAQLAAAQIVAEAEAGQFRYAPATSALENAVAERLNQAYLERRDTVIQLIYSRPLENIRIFADAFRIKEGEEEK